MFVKEILFITVGVFGLQFLHEIGHFVMARFKNVKIGFPVPIPSLQIGTFGSITPLRSFPKNREDLFDVASSGPIVTFVASSILYAFGLSLTVNAPLDILNLYPAVPAALFKTSFFTGILTSILAPKIMLLPLAQPVPLHPICCIAEVGLYTSALNLLPLGRTDGGRLSTSVFGPKSAGALSLISLALIAVICLTGKSVILIFWGLFVTILQRAPEIPTRDSASDLGEGRMTIYLGMLLMSIMTLVPFPGGSAL